jgi:hypothetical protein
VGFGGQFTGESKQVSSFDVRQRERFCQRCEDLTRRAWRAALL